MASPGRSGQEKRKAEGDGEAAGAEATGPSPLELMARRNKGMHSEKSVAAGRSFTPRPTDIFITTYPKCGTTWVTQICHQIRTGGHMDFEEISEACPWDILAFDCGQDLDADHVASPRVFKSHEGAGDIANGAKYVHVCRDPDDALISFWRFLPAFAGIPPGQISVREFTEAVFGGVSHSGGIWDFYVGWWERRNDPDVLWVCYEDLQANLEAQIRRIAAFMAVPLSDELLAIVKEKSSFAYMQAHSRQFDEHFVFEKVRDQMGIPKDYAFGDVSVSKVRAGGGTVGEKQQLPAEVLEMMSTRWEQSVYAKTGLRSYADLRAAVSQL
uniref:Sulfotransferase domain-containing protein n=1 Tax=Alexandrium monilatum TaxID=311494 RepID=A0A7S4RHN4_9DINO|mmetsp:Transcript_113717/g.362820  ORF Transcript_113717/g.362820 Transcript_113717/m.362820 type:complete len:327 (-) Transcript_113717:73-1053(-)